MTEFACSDCGSPRHDQNKVCDACGAPPSEHRATAPGSTGGVRTTDLEPYVTLRYIARLFKILAVLMIIMLVGEVIAGLMTEGGAAITTLLGEVTRLLVTAGLLWAAGDFAVLFIDAGHDLRVARILLGRINAEMHRQNGVAAAAAAEKQKTTTDARAT